jgi:16S rRNA (cytosine1402-N4)-methyltransferase
MTHVPVLLQETIEALAVKSGGTYVDGTLGRAGHAREILRRGAACVIGIDRDQTALDEVAAMSVDGSAEKPSGKLILKKGCHGDLAEIVRGEGIGEVDGILLDLGVSSPQLDDAGRGFSFRADGPLDMRMDRSRRLTAAEIVNSRTVEELTEILRAYGEEPAARRIAQAIVRLRAQARIETTSQLAELVERTVGRHGAHHPATRTFQALRMAVNDELGELSRALAGALEILKSGGRLAVITFESLSDRTVKRFFADHAGRMVSLQQGGERWEGVLPRVRRVTRRAVTASEREKSLNMRSRSAKLRAVERT